MTNGPESPSGEQPPPPQPNPYYPQQHPQQPYGQQPPYGYPQQPPYGYPQQPYGQQQPPYGYPQQAPYAYQAPVPSHPSANTAMVLGIVGLAGIITCGGITLVLSPFAWVIGARSVREINANPKVYGGLSSASAGKIMGIIGTILLVLGVLAFVAFFAWVASVDSATFDSTYDSDY